MQQSNTYFTLLQDILLIQKSILKAIRTQEEISSFLEQRQQLVAQVAVLSQNHKDDTIQSLKEEIKSIEKRIIQEASLQLDVIKHKIDHHQQDTRKMVHYFDALIQQKGSSTIDLNI